MRVKIHIELTTDWDQSTTTEVFEVARPMTDFSAETIGLSLEDGKSLLHTVQQHVVAAQTWEMAEPYRSCRACGRRQRLKDFRVRRLDTVFGTVRFRSPRLISCNCEPPCFMEVSFCPFMFIIPERATPELQRLQASLAGEMSYRRAAEVLRRFLPVSSGHNHATVRYRTLRVGERLQAAGCCPAGTPETVPTRATDRPDVAMSIDGGFVRSHGSAAPRNFEILTGRVACNGGKPYVFAWVRSEVASMKESLTGALRAKTVSFPEMSVITDGGSGVQHLHRPLPGKVRSILDWFHISMRVRYLEQIVSGLRAGGETESQVKRLLAKDVSKLRWHFWHASFEKAQAKLRRIVTLCRVDVAETPGFQSRLKHLDWRVREFFDYLDNNKGTLLDYGKRHRAGKPISTAMAESAVNQVINARICKRQQMRWSPRGAHLLAQVRCAVINGDLAPRLRRWSPALPEPVFPLALMEAPIA